MNLRNQERRIEEALTQTSRLYAAFADHLPAPLDRVVGFLHTRYRDETLNADTLLMLCDARRSRVRAEFKRYFGRPIYCYLEDLRILTAMRLLSYADIEVSRIAFEVGYAYHETFARAFKRRVGYSASQYRLLMHCAQRLTGPPPDQAAT